jgi:hypothetical protein
MEVSGRDSTAVGCTLRRLVAKVVVKRMTNAQAVAIASPSQLTLGVALKQLLRLLVVS